MFRVLVIVTAALALVACGNSSVQPFPTPQSVASQRASSATPSLQPADGCRVVRDAEVQTGTTTLTVNGSQLHLEFWSSGEPERETILPPGRYRIPSQLQGWLWEYVGCTNDQVRKQVDAHIQRRVADGANNAGYVDWTATGRFSPLSTLAPSATPARDGDGSTAGVYWETGKGLTKDWSGDVPVGQDLIVGAYAVDGVSGGVYRGYVGGQSLTLHVTDGFVLLAAATQAPQLFCSRLTEAIRSGQAHSEVQPLPGWPTCET